MAVRISYPHEIPISKVLYMGDRQQYVQFYAIDQSSTKFVSQGIDTSY